MNDVKMYDLTQRLSVHTPPWPSYMPLGIQYFKRIAGAHMGQGANGQIITTSNHVGTHMDGEVHFYPSGWPIGDVPLDEWVGPGAVADISDDVEDYGLYSPDMITKRVDVKKGDILIINTGYHQVTLWDQPGADEIRYFVKHPGPGPEFHEWALDMKLKWIAGLRLGGPPHEHHHPELAPRPLHRGRGQAEEGLRQGLGRDVPPGDLLPGHAPEALPEETGARGRTLGGEIDKVRNQRAWIGCFPLRGDRAGVVDVPHRRPPPPE